MKEFVLKNKKFVCAGLIVLSILFLILAISNLNSTERDAYKSMYDANNELYEAYIDAAEQYEGYGYSSKAQTYYLKAHALDEKIEKYKSELTTLNVQMGLYLVLSAGAVISGVLLFKTKNDLDESAEKQNDLNESEGE